MPRTVEQCLAVAKLETDLLLPKVRWAVPIEGVDYIGWAFGETKPRPGLRRGRPDHLVSGQVGLEDGVPLFVIDEHGRCWRGGKPIDPSNFDWSGIGAIYYPRAIIQQVRQFRGLYGHLITHFMCGGSDVVRRIVGDGGRQWWEPWTEEPR